MKKRTVYGLSILVAVLVIAPVLVYAAYWSSSKLDTFLEQRVALLQQLDTNAMNLPTGFEHVLPPNASAPFPPIGHIQSVVRSGQVWYGDNCSSYDLRIVGGLRDAAPREILDGLFRHLTTGMNQLGLTSPKSGGPDWIVEHRRAAHSTWWNNSDRSLIVTMSVVVDGDSDSVHITRYVHERFE